jgi:hypothetical protein
MNEVMENTTEMKSHCFMERLLIRIHLVLALDPFFQVVNGLYFRLSGLNMLSNNITIDRNVLDLAVGGKQMLATNG